MGNYRVELGSAPRPDGSVDASVTFTSPDGALTFSCVMDVASSRNLAAAILKNADECESKVRTTSGHGTCRGCSGVLMGYSRVPREIDGVYFHVSLLPDGGRALCTNPPLRFPGAGS